MKLWKKTLLLVLIIVLIFNILGYPFWDTLKSYAIMYIHDKSMQKNSYLVRENIYFHIPGGSQTSEKDWYPLMLHHNASAEFSQYIGRDLYCMILYSFGSFDFIKGSSNIYNPTSPYQGAFYGGYAIFNKKNKKPPYGFTTNGKLNIEEIRKLPMFDQTKLVLPTLGCPTEKLRFKSEIITIENDISYIGMESWTKIDAVIKTNAPTHTYNNTKYRGYIQYGKPHKKFYSDEDYPIINYKGRLYIKYIKELKGTFILYIMAKDSETIEKCDELMLSNSKIKKLS